MNNELISLLDNSTVIDTTDSSYTHNGITVPRVTAILSKMIHSDSLMYWANSLGFRHKSYKQTLQHAADLGTECHNAIDNFFDNNYIETNDILSMRSRAYESFKMWWTEINACNNVEVIYHEKTLTCKYFGGTLDGLYRINGKIYLIDYKTSNHITFKYVLQLAAYRYMLSLQGINIDGAIILQLNKSDVGFNEYFMNFDNPEHLQYINECEQAFLSLVYAYYNVSNVEKKFNEIKWRQ